MLMETIVWSFAIGLLLIICGIWLLRKILRWRRPVVSGLGRHVAFFHPYCNAGGGGERVLWVAVCAVARRYPHHSLSVYTGDVDKESAIVEKVRDRFGMELPAGLRFVRLRSRPLLEAANYPVVTLLAQSLASVFVGLEALLRLLPDVYIDSMGYGSTLPVFRVLGGCRVGCYVHYPTISADMLEVVESGRQAFNNRSHFASSPALRRLKLGYYRLFALAYRAVGAAAHVVMVNSSWTREHVASVWRRPLDVITVYPPCDTVRLRRLPLDARRRRWVVSVAQFRPEKDHALQLVSFAELLKRYPEDAGDVRLLMVGGCRDQEDYGRVAKLKALAQDLDVQDRVEFRVNISFEELLRLYSEATIGLHTMRNEHFGIGIVEMMAAGVLVVAHDSGGPRLDIVDTTEDRRSGFLASTAAEYADRMREILLMDDQRRNAIRVRARESCDRFGQEPFEAAFLAACRSLLEQ